LEFVIIKDKKLAYHIKNVYFCDMKKIGNIITNSKIEFPDYFEVYNNLDFTINNPTLIVGFKLTQKLFPDDIKVSTNEIKENIYWTFTNTEKRSNFEVDLELFTNKCIEFQIKDVKYVFVDVIQYKSSKLIKIVRKLLSISNKISVASNKMVYVYGENIIFGIDLDMCQFVGLSKKKVIDKITKISTKFLKLDEIIIEYKDFLERINNQVKFLPILYSIKNETS